MTDLGQEGNRLRAEVRRLRREEALQRETIIGLCGSCNPETEDIFGIIVQKTIAFGIGKEELASIWGYSVPGIDMFMNGTSKPSVQEQRMYVDQIKKLVGTHQNFIFY
jgi:hypothetical protein